jgi:hypothetical protein
MNSWVEKPLQLKFLLGEIHLSSVTLPALVLNVHFSRLPDDPAELALPFEKFSAHLEAILIRSHPVQRAFPRLSLLPPAIRYIPDQYRRYYIDLQGSFQDYLKGFSAKSRSTLVRKVRKFAELSGGQLSWREYRNPADMAIFYRLAREVSRKTYQERLLDVGLPDDDRFREEMLNLAAFDSARGYILFAAEKPAAYLFCPVQEDILLYQYVGYDPEYRRWSPGTVLQYVVLESLFAEGRFRMFDFTEGEGAHKEFFATASVRCADIYFFRRAWRNLLLLGLHYGLSSLSDTTVKALHLLGLKARLKRFFRSKA